MSRKGILACLVLLGVFFGFLLLHGEEEYTELTFSHGSGFYDESFMLALYAPKGTKIYYTLDGSEPDEKSIRYTEPILIEDVTERENVYSMRTDVSAGFMREEIALYSTMDLGYVAPDYPVDKCTIVRAAYIDVDGNLSESKTESYFVGYGEKPGYHGLHILSIVTAPENLFDRDNGIYVLGHINDAYMDNVQNMWNGAYWWLWDANYHQRGPSWERAATIQLFDADRRLLLNQGCGIRIQGGATRGLLPRSMNLYARGQYDDKERFYVDLFGSGYMADAITLFAGGNDRTAKLRDMIIAQLVRNRDFATMHFVPYAMFLDGEYWGVYWLTEKYDAAFLEYYYHAGNDNVIMIKNQGLAEGEQSDYTFYEEMMAYMAHADFSIQGEYERACQMIDMQSFIDYYATEIYIARHADWPGSNEALWRSREIQAGEFADGKWRWMLFDVNSGGISSGLSGVDTIQMTREASPMFRNLCRNDSFCKQFVVSFMDIANTCFRKQDVDAIITEYLAFMTEPMDIHRKRFSGMDDITHFIDAVDDIQIFFDNRRAHIVQYLKEDFGLVGSLVPVEIEINDATAGNVMVNTAALTFGNERTWSGEYYTDFPITLTAYPREGYRFVRWESSVPTGETSDGAVSCAGNSYTDQRSYEEESIEVPLTESGLNIKAIFEKIG